MIAGHAIHALCGKRNAAEDVAAAHDDTYLDTFLRDGGNLLGQVFDAVGINAKRSRPGHGLAAQLEKNATVFRHCSCSVATPAVQLAFGSAGVSVAGPKASPTLNRANRETVMFSPS